jgi:hypothetical protein
MHQTQNTKYRPALLPSYPEFFKCVAEKYRYIYAIQTLSRVAQNESANRLKLTKRRVVPRKP